MATTKHIHYLGAAVLSAALLFGSGAALAAAAGGPLPGEGLSQSYRESQMDNLEYQKVEPIKMADNLFYVGPGYVGVYLITTPEGHILIDGSEDPYVDHVLGNIRKVGFDPPISNTSSLAMATSIISVAWPRFKTFRGRRSVRLQKIGN